MKCFYRKIFGFSKNAFKFILDKILHELQGSARNRDYLTPVQKLAVFLDFLRTNSFQRVIGTQMHNQISQSRSCVIINSVAATIARLRGEVIIFRIFFDDFSNIYNFLSFVTDISVGKFLMIWGIDFTLSYLASWSISTIKINEMSWCK